MSRSITYLFIFSLVIIAACQQAPSSTQTEGDDTEAEILDDRVIIQQLIIGAFNEIWSNLDTSKIKDFHTDDFLLIENGLVWNNDSIVNYQKAELLRMNEYGYKRQNKFEFLKIEKTPTTIWAAYDNFATWITHEEITGRAHWLESAVAIKTDGGWKLQMLHSTRVRE